MSVINASVDEIVAQAASFLDEVRPSWFNLIDFSKLDIYDPWNCVLGQVFAFNAEGNCLGGVRNGYDWALRVYGDKMTERASAAFFVMHDVSELKTAWINAVTERTTVNV